MSVLLYLLASVGIWFVIAILVEFHTATKIIQYFRDNPNGLPEVLPPYVQEFKDEVGDANFNKLYRHVMGR